MSTPISITLDEYIALLSLAKEGKDTDTILTIEDFAKAIDKRNGLTRYFLFVRWQEAKPALPPTTDFPAVWPPAYKMKLERTDRPIAQDDVTKALSTRAKDPQNILVTQDPAGNVGWTKGEDYFR